MVDVEKKCSCCGESKILSKDYFYPSKYKPDGFADNCRVCEVEKVKSVSKPYVNIHSEKAKAREEKRLAYNKKMNAIYTALKNGHKECSKCLQTKSLFDFNVDRKMATGYSSWCKDCKRSSKEDKAKEQQHDTSIGQQEGSSPEISNR